MVVYFVGVGEGVTKMVTVGIGVGSGFTGTSASPGFKVGAPRTTATTPSVEKFVYKSTVALCAMEPAELSTAVTYPTGTPGTNGRFARLY